MSELRRLFDLVCDLPVAQRDPALRAAGANSAMVADVLALVELDAGAQTQTSTPGTRFAAQLVTTELSAGEVLGAWRLLREIGHGGMGAVFLAERADGHFNQQAALKLIRGLASGEAAARFARERQLLANLQHPQIAHLLDGGATPRGQPYLVMEYIDGRPLDIWCREHNASLDARLRIFVSICKTLQFAHQRLIVHCDLKPSNVLVRDDGVPVLLDFGIARALDRSEAGVGIGDAGELLTPRYASPEQRRGETLTIASDIYSLGVLLHELVSAASSPPASPAERIQPILRPSVGAAPDLPWRKRLRGDIDAIVQRACALDPGDRYSSALAFADDIERIAAHQPVQARRATLAYIGSRLVRRRRSVFAVALLGLMAATGFTWRTLLAEREARAQAATAERTRDFLVSVFAASDSNANTGLNHQLTARDVLDAGLARIHTELADEPRARADLLEALGNAYRHMDLGDVAAPLLREAADIDLQPGVDQPLAAARCLEALANTLANGEFPAEQAEKAARDSLALAERLTEAGSQPIANAWMVLSLALNSKGALAQAQMAAEKSLAMNERLPMRSNRLPQALGNLGMIASRRGDPAVAIGYYQRQLDLQHANGEEHTGGFALNLNNFATALSRNGDYARAITMQQQALALAKDIYGERSGFAATYATSLVRIQIGAGAYAEALSALPSVLDLTRQIKGEGSGEYNSVLVQFGYAYRDSGNYAQALPLLRRALDYRIHHLGASEPRVLQGKTAIAALLLDMGQTSEEVRSLLSEALDGWRAHGEAGVDVAHTLIGQARERQLQGDHDAAIRLLDQAQAPAIKSDQWTCAEAAALRAQIAQQSADVTATLRYDEQAWGCLRDRIGAQHPQTARYGLILARDLRAAGEAARADVLEQQLRPIFDAAFPADSVFRSAIARATLSAVVGH